MTTDKLEVSSIAIVSLNCPLCSTPSRYRSELRGLRSREWHCDITVASILLVQGSLGVGEQGVIEITLPVLPENPIEAGGDQARCVD